MDEVLRSLKVASTHRESLANTTAMSTESNGASQGAALHYEEASEVPSNIRKYGCVKVLVYSYSPPYRYWQQRYNIWSKYDEGILMTDDAWFGVTPEPVAM